MSTDRYIVAVEAVIYHEGRYLTIVRSEQDEHAPGTLSFPAGKVEAAGETVNVLEQTVRREVMEEVGVEIAPEVVYVGNNAFFTDTGEPVVLISFLCRYQSGAPLITDPSEVAAIEWLTVEQILAHPKAPAWTHRTLRAAEAKRTMMGW